MGLPTVLVGLEQGRSGAVWPWWSCVAAEELYRVLCVVSVFVIGEDRSMCCENVVV